ncbi:hypothetical protein LCGC14_2571720, partial [marine sediment metagenome]
TRMTEYGYNLGTMRHFVKEMVSVGSPC